MKIPKKGSPGWLVRRELAREIRETARDHFKFLGLKSRVRRDDDVLVVEIHGQEFLFTIDAPPEVDEYLEGMGKTP